jgi:hypothetical protein
MIGIVYKRMNELEEKIRVVIEAIRSPDWLPFFDSAKVEWTNDEK